MASTTNFAASADDDTSSSSSSISIKKDDEQKSSAVPQPQPPTEAAAAAAAAAVESSSSSSSDNAVKRTRTSATNLIDGVVGDAGSSGADAKRHRPNDKEYENKNEEEVLDLAVTLGMKDGDRLQVKWEISNDDNVDDNGNNAEESSTEAATTTTVHWWTATLLPHDGRVVDQVAIRTLDYDPYPEGGFPERSREDVVFLGPDLLVDPVTRDDLRFRRLGETHDIDDDVDDDEEEISDDTNDISIENRNDWESLVNEALAHAFHKQSAKWQSLSVAQQAQIASAVAEKKEILLTLLEQHRGGVVTATVMQQLLAQAMQMTSSSTTSSTTLHNY